MIGDNLKTISNRHEMTRYFDGYSSDRREEMDELRRRKGPLVKSHLLELLNGQSLLDSGSLMQVMQRRGVSLRQIDDSLFLLSEPMMGDIGFLEQLGSRVVSLYSTAHAEELSKWTNGLVGRSPEIDHVWLSGQTFAVLWNIVAKLAPSHRFSRLVFQHENVYDRNGLTCDSVDEEDNDEDESAAFSDGEGGSQIRENRDTRFALVDRIGEIQKILGQLQNIYSPLYAINQLRFPSPVGKGGHHFYYDGRVTNTSESFRDHRSHVLFVVRIYERLLSVTEKEAWYSITESAEVPRQFSRIVGSPVIIRFHEPLSSNTFEHWIRLTFERKVNKFRLWGHPIRLGPTKVHVYGVDRHLWQPLFLELTEKGLTAIVPNGTCGNTVHRLVTNIQRYLAPGLEAFIGDRPYKQIVEESASGVDYEPKSD